MIACDGIECTTVREIARLTNNSSSIVSGYLRSKHELLLCACCILMERATAL
ncbi:hypothetical protein V474_13960 [Novosphingobium barchaimii LL02]|uniref:HTH tetR-type domain-containing protein n=1 Tax=Novosphingobium barchaimii LL02 TaxID=1114963 RepID=A0A0J7XZI2_9SPHN|nr:hypothetical protein [Novosphingobium barchaimii]KMS56618.1 hypothetical protein V474_13960 [Novosphingobium barchaimii LL02]